MAGLPHRTNAHFRYLANACIILILVAIVVLPFDTTVSAAPSGSFVVDVMTDTGSSQDDNPGDGICHTASNNCTLRAAIMEANSHIGSDIITFAPDVIAVIVQTALPPLNDTSGGTTIFGGIAKVDVLGTLPGAGTNGFVLVSNNNRLQGLDIAAFKGNGVVIQGASNIIGTDGDGVNDENEGNIIRENTLNGILVDGTGNNNRISGNVIGLDQSGNTKPNLANGIEIAGASNRVGVLGDGVSDSLEANTIHRNGQIGVYIHNNGNIVSGNSIRFNGDDGIYVYSASGNLIGTNGNNNGDAEERNTISSNIGWGIFLNLATETTISGNRVGTSPDGTAANFNQSGGIYIFQGSANLIGTDGSGAGAANEGNLVSGNLGDNILLDHTTNNTVAGNIVGPNIGGTASITPNARGIALLYSQGNTVGTNGNGTGDSLEGNLVSGNHGNGIHLYYEGTQANIVAGNIVGLTASGTAALPNQENGIMVGGSTSGNRIGTDGNGVSDALERNIISGNTLNGIIIERGIQNSVSGNYIGTDKNGSAGIGNAQHGIKITGGSTNYIGINNDITVNPIEGNVISGNGLSGIFLAYDTANPTSANYIQGNWIGTAANGISPLENTNDGVLLERVEDNAIGWDKTNLGNVIAYHATGAGIRFTSADQKTGNRFLGNRMFGNSIGIDLGAIGVTMNDNMDIDTGPNGLQNFPVLLGAEVASNTISVAVSLGSKANANYGIDFYLTSSCNQNGYGQGEIYLGYGTVHTDASGNYIGQLGVTLSGTGSTPYMVATASDTEGSTSEFSQCILVDGLGGSKVYLPLILR